MLQATATCLVALDAVLLVFVTRATGGLLRSPFNLLLASIPVATIILVSRPGRGLGAFAMQLMSVLAALWHWRASHPLPLARTSAGYDVFADPGFIQAFAVTAVLTMLLSSLCLTLRKAEMRDMAANAFLAGRGGPISYTDRMGRSR
jgi:hypothetical protein